MSVAITDCIALEKLELVARHSHEVQSHAKRDRRHEVRIRPKRQDQQGLVFAQRVACVEHLDDDQNGERHGGRSSGGIV